MGNGFSVVKVIKKTSLIIINLLDVLNFMKIGCNIYGVVSSIGSFASIASISAIGFEKYLMIRNPFLRFEYRTKPMISKIFKLYAE
jgi:hypothetical protein